MLESILLGYFILGLIIVSLFVKIGEPKLSRKEYFFLFIFAPVTITLFAFRLLSFIIENTIEFIFKTKKEFIVKEIIL